MLESAQYAHEMRNTFRRLRVCATCLITWGKSRRVKEKVRMVLIASSFTYIESCIYCYKIRDAHVMRAHYTHLLYSISTSALRFEDPQRCLLSEPLKISALPT